jgi:hypothetical protein
MTEQEYQERLRENGGRFFKPKPQPRIQVEPKLTITKRITAEWPNVQTFNGVDRTKTDRVPGFGASGVAA